MMISSLVLPQQHPSESPSVISSSSSSSSSLRLLPSAMEDTFTAGTVDVRTDLENTTTTTTTTKTTKKKSSNLLKKSVSFTTVEIRHYPITIDVNDETSAEGRGHNNNNYNYYGQQRGLPITLDWWWNDSKAVSSSSTSTSLSSLSSSEDGNHNIPEHSNNNTTVVRLDTLDQKHHQHQVIVLDHGFERDEELATNKKNDPNDDNDRQPDVTSCSCSSSSCSSSSTSSSPSPESIISNNCSSDNDNNDNSMRNNAYCRRDELGLQMTPMQRIRKLRRAGFTLQELHTAMKHKRGSI